MENTVNLDDAEVKNIAACTEECRSKNIAANTDEGTLVPTLGEVV